jgi:large subunit ribosomal protein L3
MTYITNWGLYLKKQEMTRLWIDNRFVTVTLAAEVEQRVKQHKTNAVDWYSAIVVDVKTWARSSMRSEFRVKEDVLAMYPVGSEIPLSILEGLSVVRVSGTSKGKWFQWVMKRHNFSWGPKTHGSKFHRAWWSTGNRKPRRTHKGHPMAWQMWGDTITLRSLPIVSLLIINDTKFVAFKGSVPGSYSSFIKVSL